MENYTFNSFVLQMEGINVTKDLLYTIFFLLLTFYIVTMILNVGFLILTVIDKNLHQPMYLLFCNLTVSDIVGSSQIFPRMLSDLLKPPSERLIGYYECVIQAFVNQWFSSTSHTVLMVMAFDRYVAICYSLRYSAIMNNSMVMKLSLSAWAVPLIFVVVLIGLSVRLNRCRTLVSNPYCDNASLFKLSCDSVVINNIYGLFYTAVLLGSSVGCILLTYGKIVVVCFTSKNKSLNRKAFKTCSTHLVVYLIMFFSGFTAIALHRFPQYSDYRKITSLLFFVVPGSLNSIIYGVQSKEVRSFLSKIFISNRNK
ncbi:olfactory receptor 52N4-like [Cyprinodon tularosa]|uniref:olfactory receptor 52N4-like n=1 Tax=Cyprinodon tularosa TaxID=77115 RepID=UPI0018E21D5D|nr:olfactory receptor 52N4-like [Cyprinodon tularosa]